MHSGQGGWGVRWHETPGPPRRGLLVVLGRSPAGPLGPAPHRLEAPGNRGARLRKHFQQTAKTWCTHDPRGSLTGAVPGPWHPRRMPAMPPPAQPADLRAPGLPFAQSPSQPPRLRPSLPRAAPRLWARTRGPRPPPAARSATAAAVALASGGTEGPARPHASVVAAGHPSTPRASYPNDERRLWLSPISPALYPSRQTPRQLSQRLPRPPPIPATAGDLGLHGRPATRHRCLADE